jgi:Domain of unknown function (DUF1937)
MAEARSGAGDLVRFGQSPATIARGWGGRQPVYLATPYSREVVGADGVWEYARSVEVARGAALASAALMAAGVTAVSPIVLSAAMVHATCRFEARRSAHFAGTIDPLDHARWMAWCMPLLRSCGAVVVPDLPGWDRSLGIWAEVREALDRAMPVMVYATAEVAA